MYNISIFYSTVGDLKSAMLLLDSSKYLSIQQQDLLTLAYCQNAQGNIYMDLITLNAEETDAYNNFKSFVNFIIDLDQQGKFISKLDSSSLMTMQNLYVSSYEPQRTYINNILVQNNALIYQEPIVLPNYLMPQQSVGKKKINTTKNPDIITIFPNPSRNYVVVGYKLGKISSTDVIEMNISDMSGISIYSKHLSTSENQTWINTSNFKSGSYVCSILLNGHKIDSEVFVKQ